MPLNTPNATREPRIAAPGKRRELRREDLFAKGDWVVMLVLFRWGNFPRS
jgi:hypothetical protein